MNTPTRRIAMWMNYRRNHFGQATAAVPSPADGDPGVPWWYDRIATLAKSLAEAGVTDVLFPNPVMNQGGVSSSADGYGPFDDYDIGSKGKPTRFGTAEQLRRAVAVCHSVGINVHIDHVMHQRSGGRDRVYKYRSATAPDNGRFSKHPECFRGAVSEDPVPDPKDDFAFGDELCPVNARPRGYVWDGLIAAGDWLFRTLDADGARLDDMKGMNIGFVTAFMSSKAMRGKFFFGEYASGNSDDTNWWVDQVKGLASAIDFDFHYNAAEPMCNGAGAGSFFMGALAGKGMIASNPMKAIPFVESMDSDTDGFATIVNNKLLGYALLLGGEGLPLIYIKDYLPEPDGYGLETGIRNLMWCHQMLANGPAVPRLTTDPKIYVFERTGEPGLLVTLNNDVFNPDWHTVSVQTAFGPHTQLHDYTGRNGSDVWTDGEGRVTLGIPPGADGTGYGMWSRPGQEGPIEVSGRSTTQTFFGADDLDTDRVRNGVRLLVGRVWCAKNAPIRTALVVDRSSWSGQSAIEMDIIGPDSTALAVHSWRDQNIAHPFAVQCLHEGWHAVQLRGIALPADGSDFELSITYTAPQGI